MLKKIFLLALFTSLSFAKYTQYKPSEDFAKYFAKQNCSQVLDKFYYINCYDYNYKGTKAVAYKLEVDNLKGEQIKKRPRFEDDTNIPKNIVPLGVIIKIVVMIEDTLFLMPQ